MPNQESQKPTSYSEQQYLAFQKATEVLATSENVKIISTPILEARLEKIQRNAFSSGRETFEILGEIYLITDELDEREKIAKKELAVKE